jgi:hypothetical protein
MKTYTLTEDSLSALVTRLFEKAVEADETSETTLTQAEIREIIMDFVTDTDNTNRD